MSDSSGVQIPNLKKWRLWKGLGQEELAERAKIATPTISRIENGGIARFGTVAKLAQALGIEREQLLHAEPKKERAAA